MDCRMRSHFMFLVLVAGCIFQTIARDTCPGTINIAGGSGGRLTRDRTTLVNANVNVPGEPAGFVEVKDHMIVPHMSGRTYFAEACTSDQYDHNDYKGLKLLGNTMRYTIDLHGAGCGCNAALYLTSMKQNENPSECHDYYCDANNVCGESCAEIDIQEANTASWHSTLHTMNDHSGVGGGYGGGPGWTGPRDWDSSQYGPNASCINTLEPIKVAVSFPVDAGGTLTAMTLTLAQDGHSCTLSINLGSYAGMADLSSALAAGMTPIISYWSGDMLWMDGKGEDQRGPCWQDNPETCEDTVKFYGFSITKIGDPEPVVPVSYDDDNDEADKKIDDKVDEDASEPAWQNPAAFMKEALSHLLNLAGDVKPHSLASKINIASVTLLSIAAIAAAVMFGVRRWRHRLLYAQVPLSGDAAVMQLAPEGEGV